MCKSAYILINTCLRRASWEMQLQSTTVRTVCREWLNLQNNMSIQREYVGSSTFQAETKELRMIIKQHCFDGFLEDKRKGF